MFNFAEHLKAIRLSKGITQKQLGEAIGSSERGIQNYELGISKPKYEAIVALADYFDISLDYLTGRSSDPERH